MLALSSCHKALVSPSLGILLSNTLLAATLDAEASFDEIDVFWPNIVLGIALFLAGWSLVSCAKPVARRLLIGVALFAMDRVIGAAVFVSVFRLSLSSDALLGGVVMSFIAGLLPAVLILLAGGYASGMATRFKRS